MNDRLPVDGTDVQTNAAALGPAPLGGQREGAPISHPADACARSAEAHAASRAEHQQGLALTHLATVQQREPPALPRHDA